MSKRFGFVQHPGFLAIATLLVLSSCAKKPEETAMAPSPASPSTAASTAPAPAATTSPHASSTMAKPAANTPSAKPALSAEALKLGVKPENATTCPENAPVKGNVTKKRGSLYFTSKFPDYKMVKPEICFKDTQTAEKAGFRAPK